VVDGDLDISPLSPPPPGGGPSSVGVRGKPAFSWLQVLVLPKSIHKAKFVNKIV